MNRCSYRSAPAILQDRAAVDEGPGRGDLVTLSFADEAAAEVAAQGATWSLGDHVVVERTGRTVRARAEGAADRVARFISDLEVAGSPVQRVEVAVAALTTSSSG